MSHHNHSLMSIHHNKGQLTRTIILILLLVLSILWGSVFGIVWAGLRLILWVIVFLLLPWRRITKALWKHDEIDLFERFILSFAFSISVVPLLVFYVNIIWIPVSERLVIWVIVCIIAICIWYFIKQKKE